MEFRANSLSLMKGAWLRDKRLDLKTGACRLKYRSLHQLTLSSLVPHSSPPRFVNSRVDVVALFQLDILSVFNLILLIPIQGFQPKRESEYEMKKALPTVLSKQQMHGRRKC